MISDMKSSIDTNKAIRWCTGATIFLLSVYVVVNPFAHTTSIKEICFYGSLLAFVAAIVAGKRDFWDNPTPLRTPTLMFVGWVLVGLIWAQDRQNTWHDIYSHLFRYIVLYFLLINFFSLRKNTALLSWFFSLSIVVFIIYALWNHFIVTDKGVFQRFMGNSEGMTYNLLSIPAIISIFFVSCNAFTTTEGQCRRFLPLFLLAPLITGLILTRARSAFLAVGVAGFIFLLCLKKKLIPVLLIILACLLFLFVPLKQRFGEASLKNLRVAHALLVLEVTKDYPVTGIGFGMESFGKALDLTAYKKRITERYGVNYSQEEVLIDPHNMYTDILVRTGIPGFLLFLAFVFQLNKMIWSSKRSNDPFLRVWSVGIGCSLISYFVIGFFEPVFSHMHEFNFMILVGFSSILWQQHILSIQNEKMVHNIT